MDGTVEKCFHIFNLVVNITGGAMIGPVSNFLPTKELGTFLNLTWRYMPMTLWLVLAAIFQETRQRWKNNDEVMV